MLRRGSVLREESLWPEREEGEESRQACAMEVEVMVEKLHVGQEIDESNTL